MSVTAVDKVSSSPELQVSGSNRQQIRKTFNLLKSHASAVANFTLQWQDLEDHLQSIHKSIQSKLYDLQNPQFSRPKPNSNANSAAEAQQQSQSQSKPAEQSNSNSIPIHDGRKLVSYLKSRLKQHDSMRDDVRNALEASEDSGKLVLDAIGGFHPADLKTGTIDSELSAVRRSCLLLLEELIKVRPLISTRVREEASKLASVWKSKIKVEMLNSMEVFGFLMLLVGYGLVGEYDRDEILSLVGNVVQRRQAPELFKSLGLSDKASDFILNLISQKKYLEAVRFIYAFELVDKFPPVPLLQDHLKDAKKAARTIWKKSKSSKEKDDATNKEIAALRGVIRCIEDYKLESEYSPEELKERVDRLRKQKNERKEKEKNAKQKAPAPKAQAQQLSGKKRAFFDSKSQMKNLQNGNKRIRVAQVATAPHLSARAPATVHSVHHQPVGMFEGERIESLMPSASARMAAGGERIEYLMPAASARMAAAPAAASPVVPARAAVVHAVHHLPVDLLEGEGVEYLLTSAAAAAPGPSTSFGAASNFYSTEASHYQPADSYTGQGTQYSFGYNNLVRSALDTHTSLPPGSHGLVASPTQRMSLTSGAYSLPTGSVIDAHHIRSVLYGLASAGHLTAYLNSSADHCGTSGRNGQFETPEASQRIVIPSNASPRGSLAYYPDPSLRVAATHSDRPLSSNSGYDYELPSKRSHVFHL